MTARQKMVVFRYKALSLPFLRQWKQKVVDKKLNEHNLKRTNKQMLYIQTRKILAGGSTVLHVYTGRLHNPWVVWVPDFLALENSSKPIYFIGNWLYMCKVGNSFQQSLMFCKSTLKEINGVFFHLSGSLQYLNLIVYWIWF